MAKRKPLNLPDDHSLDEFLLDGELIFASGKMTKDMIRRAFVEQFWEMVRLGLIDLSVPIKDDWVDYDAAKAAVKRALKAHDPDMIETCAVEEWRRRHLAASKPH